MKWMTGTLLGFLTVLIVLVALSIQCSQSAVEQANVVKLDFSVHEAQQKESVKHILERIDELHKDIKDVKEMLKKQQQAGLFRGTK